MPWKHTGVFVTKEEREALMRESREVMQMPCIIINEGRMDTFKKKIHTMALARGLPELLPDADGDPYLYGMSADGEFVTLETSRIAEEVLP